MRVYHTRTVVHGCFVFNHCLNQQQYISLLVFVLVQNEWGKYFLESEDGVGAVDDAIKSPHHHLKVMKYCGYYGMASDVQLVSYILENCVALQKLIIDPAISKSRRLSIGSAEYKLKYEKTGRENAKQQLEALVPRHIELVIL